MSFERKAMRPITRAAITALATAGLSFSLLPQAVADVENGSMLNGETVASAETLTSGETESTEESQLGDNFAANVGTTTTSETESTEKTEKTTDAELANKKETIEVDQSVGPFCGLEALANPAALPKTFDFKTADGKTKSLPVKVFKQGKPVTPEEWKALIVSTLTTDRPWGEDSVASNLTYSIDHERYEGGGRIYISHRRLVIAVQKPITVQVVAGEELNLPEKVEINFTTETGDGSGCQNVSNLGWKSTEIAWDALTPEQQTKLNTPGEKFTVKGTAKAPVPGGLPTLDWPRKSANYYGFDALVDVVVVEPPKPESTDQPVAEPKADDSKALAKTGVNTYTALAVATLLGSTGAGLLLFSRRRDISAE